MQTIDNLEDLLPLLAGITKRDAFCRVILDNVPAKLKTPLGRAARDFFGHPWPDRSLAVGLTPGQHTEKHRRQHKAAMTAWRDNNPDYNAAWRDANPDYWAEYFRDRRANDPAFKIANNLRNRLYCAIKASGAGKSASTIELTGCTLPELMAHLEVQFTEGMTWANQGEWEIDHIKPCASFDLTKPEEQRACFHWTNLAPLWRADNRSKGDRLDWSPNEPVVEPTASNS